MGDETGECPDVRDFREFPLNGTIFNGTILTHHSMRFGRFEHSERAHTEVAYRDVGGDQPVP